MAKNAKNDNKAKKTKKAPKQPALPGVTTDRPVVNAKVEKAAEAYREVRDERMAMAEPEAKAKEDLAKAMKDAGLTEYEYTIDDEETGLPKKLRVAYEEETETTLTVRTVKEKKKKAEAA